MSVLDVGEFTHAHCCGDPGGGADIEALVPAATSPARGIATGCPPTDQLGNPRPEPCTAGAVEAP